MWSSTPFLQSVASLSVLIALVSGTIAVVASFVGTVAANRASDSIQREAKVEIAAANARAEEAKEGAARASEEAARLRLEMEKERTARLKLEESVQPRKIKDDQKQLITNALINSPKGQVYINPDWTDPEAKIFAAQIAGVLEPLGFPIDRLTGDHAPLSFGKLGAFFVIRDGQQQPPHLKPLHDAFRSAGFVFDVYTENYVPDTKSVLIGVSTH
jgi:hypothetical protein